MQEVTAGLTAGGEVPYGGAIEIEAFVKLECLGNFTVRVWAAPGDPSGAAAAGAERPKLLPCSSSFGRGGDGSDGARACMKDIEFGFAFVPELAGR